MRLPSWVLFLLVAFSISATNNSSVPLEEYVCKFVRGKDCGIKWNVNDVLRPCPGNDCSQCSYEDWGRITKIVLDNCGFCVDTNHEFRFNSKNTKGCITKQTKDKVKVSTSTTESFETKSTSTQTGNDDDNVPHKQTTEGNFIFIADNVYRATFKKSVENEK